MKAPLQLLGLFALLLLCCGCDQLSQKLGIGEKKISDASTPTTEKPATERGHLAPGETSRNTPAATVAKAPPVDEATQFNVDYEKWKLRAVEEFPEIGKAGSRFNQQFLQEAKKLRESNAPELAHPNWPYLLALMVNTSLERSANAQAAGSLRPEVSPTNTSAQTTAAQSQEQPDNPERFGSYRVSDLTKMRTLPKVGVFKGTITRAEKQVASGDLDIVITLDGLLQCEINLDRNTTATRNLNGY